MLLRLPCKTCFFGLLLLVLLCNGCREEHAGRDGAAHQNFIVLLDLSNRIVKSPDQIERDIYLVNTIYQAFGNHIVDALDRGAERIEHDRFRLLLACSDDPARYSQLLAQLQVDPSTLTSGELRQRFGEEGTIAFSSALYKLYDLAAEGSRGEREGAIRRFFNERLPMHLSDASGTANQLFLITDGHKPAPTFVEVGANFPHPLPELNVLLLEADPGKGAGAWRDMIQQWTGRLRDLGVRFVGLEKRQTGILAVRSKIHSLLMGAEELPIEGDFASPIEPETPAGQEKTGRVTSPAKFWLGRPEDKGAMALLNIEPDAEVLLLDQVGDYFKVQHRQLIGYIERRNVQVIVPEEKTSASAAVQASQPAVAQHVSVTPCTGALGDELLPGVSCAQYKAKVLKKVADLETYIQTIVDKSALNRDKAVDLACGLFVDEKAQVYTSSMEGARRGRPVRRYLEGLMALSYDHVEIEWTNIQYVSGLRKGPDGRFFGTVQIEQRFEGFIDGRPVYGDVTAKNITVVLEAYEIIDAQGNANTRWDVFLSDIGVEQTRIQG